MQNITLGAINDDIVEFDENITLNIQITTELMKIRILPGNLSEMVATIAETDGETISKFHPLAFCFVMCFSCHCFF